MRDIKFRGKHIHSLEPNKKLDGIWVYGYLCSENYIWSDELCGDMLVDKNTIGQFTGLKFKKESNFECASRSYDYLKQYQTMLDKMQEMEQVK